MKKQGIKKLKAILVLLAGTAGIQCSDSGLSLQEPVYLEQSVLSIPGSSEDVRLALGADTQREPIQKWIRYFSGRGRGLFQKFLNRGSWYAADIEALLSEHSMPPELYFLAMMESGFRIRTVSHAGAGGIWQFIPNTAKSYGLTVNASIDERFDTRKATVAAIHYLRDLYALFGDWPLAMAAYNAGEGRVGRAIKRHGTSDFWELVKRRALPKETREYVPKILASIWLGRNSAELGFHFPPPVRPQIIPVEVQGQLWLPDLARLADLSVHEVRQMNPHLKSPFLIAKDPAQVYLKRTAAKRIRRNAKDLQQTQTKVADLISKKRILHHRVRYGDNIGRIAAKYGVSGNSIKKWNPWHSPKVRRGKYLAILLPESRSRKKAKSQRGI